MLTRWPVYVLLVAALVLLLALFLESTKQSRRAQQQVAQATVATAWPLHQARVEVERFRTALAQHVAYSPEVTFADVMMRFEILMSRVPLLDADEILHTRWRNDTPEQLKAQAYEVLAVIEEELDGRVDARGDLELIGQADPLLAPLSKALGGMLVDFQNEQHRLYESTKRTFADMSRQKNRLITTFLGLTLLLLALSFNGMQHARRAEARFKAFAGSGSDWLWETDQRGRVTFVSPGWAKMFGCEPKGDGAGQADFFSAALNAPDEHELRILFARRTAFRDVRCGINTTAGELRTVELSGVPVTGRGGRFEGFRGVATDISERLGQERRIRYMAEHDTLTGLKNRAALLGHLEELLNDASMTPPRLALLALDLDGFKAVNDALGHDIGDKLLVEVALRLQGATRRSDLIARFGGDEFAILQQSGEATAEAAVGTAARIIDELARPFAIDGQRIEVGASIGIAICPEHVRTAAGLIKDADLALYRAKQEGRNCYRLYTASMGQRLHRRREVEVALRAALQDDELFLHYQPLVRLSDRQVVAVEALARWHHTRLGEIGPAEFIPVAEATGLILPLGIEVLQSACRTAAGWTGPMADVGVSVNLSIAQLAQAGLADDVGSILKATGLAPQRLTLEITESMLMGDPARGIRILEDLRALGVHLAIDDFGTGYSSLAYLRRFPVTKVKLDRSFVNNIASRDDDRHIIHGMISMTHALGMTAVAEGVEMVEQQQVLEQLGCDEIQGYLVGRPMPIERLLMQAGDASLPLVAPVARRALVATAVS